MKATHSLGDLISYLTHYGETELAYVIGRLAKYQELLCVATETTTGMTINEQHCKIISSDLPTATRLRQRYLDAFPGVLKGEPQP